MLSGTRSSKGTNASTNAASTRTERSLDAQAQAAALLSGERPAAAEAVETTAATLGDHPAVIVTRTRKPSIDPNTFIVAHPAGLQLTSTGSFVAQESSETSATATVKVITSAAASGN